MVKISKGHDLPDVLRCQRLKVDIPRSRLYCFGALLGYTPYLVKDCSESGSKVGDRARNRTASARFY